MVKNSTRNRSINGLSPLSYLGVNPTTPPNFYSINRDPTTTDSQDFSLCDLWLNTATEAVWILVNLNNHVATWVKFTDNVGSVLSLTGNTGGAVFPTANNINVVGDTIGITIAGNPATSTLTASLVGGGIAAQSFPTDSGTATPNASGVLNIKAGQSTQNSGSSVFFSGASNTVTLNVSDASNNTIIGKGAGNASLTSTNVTSVGASAASALTSGTNGCFFGFQAGNAYTTETFNVIMGPSLVGRVGETNCIRIGTANGSGTQNIFIGQQCGNNTYTVASAKFNVGIGPGVFTGLTTASDNTAIGHSALNSLSSGATNTACGSGVLQLCTTGAQNVGVGDGALATLSTSNGNTAVGQNSMNLATTAATNTSIGVNSLQNLTTGSNNVAAGNQALNNLTTGSQNIGIGLTAGSNYTGAETNNILIGTNCTGTLGESNVTRLGQVAVQLKCFIAGIRGVTTDAADAIAVLISSTGQLGTVSSSKRFKEHIKDMGDYSNLLMALRPVVFNFKNDSTKSKQVGLIAEEVEDILPRLVAHDEEDMAMSVKYHDLPVMLLNELQKQNKQLEELHIRLAKLEKMVGIK